MSRESAYIETSVVSYLAARPSRDLVTAGRQRVTHEWWAEGRGGYDLYISRAVLDEAARGDAQAAERRLHYLEGLAELDLDGSVRDLTRELLAAGAVPAQARVDAVHIAVATVHRVDYLLTWNFKHIANPHQWRRIHGICRSSGYHLPVACSPDQLLAADDRSDNP